MSGRHIDRLVKTTLGRPFEDELDLDEALMQQAALRAELREHTAAWTRIACRLQAAVDRMQATLAWGRARRPHV